MNLLRQILKDRSAAHALLAIAVWLLAVAAPLAATGSAATTDPLCAEIAAGGGKAADLPHDLACAVHCHAVPAAPLAAMPPSPGEPLRVAGIDAMARVAATPGAAGQHGPANRARAPPRAA